MKKITMDICRIPFGNMLDDREKLRPFPPRETEELLPVKSAEYKCEIGKILQHIGVEDGIYNYRCGGVHSSSKCTYDIYCLLVLCKTFFENPNDISQLKNIYRVLNNSAPLLLFLSDLFSDIREKLFLSGLKVPDKFVEALECGLIPEHTYIMTLYSKKREEKKKDLIHRWKEVMFPSMEDFFGFLDLQHTAIFDDILDDITRMSEEMGYKSLYIKG